MNEYRKTKDVMCCGLWFNIGTLNDKQIDKYNSLSKLNGAVVNRFLINTSVVSPELIDVIDLDYKLTRELYNNIHRFNDERIKYIKLIQKRQSFDDLSFLHKIKWTCMDRFVLLVIGINIGLWVSVLIQWLKV